MDRPSTPSPSIPRIPASRAAFGRPQLILALVCLGLAACLLALWMRRHQMTERCESYLADMDFFARATRKAFERQGSAPPGGGNLPALPKGMETYLSKDRWLRPTPFGGGYHWLSPYPPEAPPPTPKDSEPLIGAVQVNGFPPRGPVHLSAGELAYLRQRFAENAVPGTKLVVGFNGWPLCLVYATP